MKRLPVFLLLLYVLLSWSFTPVAQQKYLPDEVKGLYIGISIDSLGALRGNHLERTITPAGLPVIVEILGEENPRFEKISYFFNKNNELYEIILYGRKHFYLETYMNDFYGKPNFNENEWLFPIENGVELYIWQYLDRWCIADGAAF